MIGEDYTKWLINSTELINYDKLLYHLARADFYWWMVLDENRACAGLSLRERYSFEVGIYQSDVADGPCSVLEMLIALSEDLEQQCGAKTSQEFFFEMLSNLKLIKYSDNHYDENAVGSILKKWMDRDYAADGSGSIFKFVPNTDMRKLDIWGQMLRYINYYYPLDKDFLNN